MPVQGVSPSVLLSKAAQLPVTAVNNPVPETSPADSYVFKGCDPRRQTCVDDRKNIFAAIFGYGGAAALAMAAAAKRRPSRIKPLEPGVIIGNKLVEIYNTVRDLEREAGIRKGLTGEKGALVGDERIRSRAERLVLKLQAIYKSTRAAGGGQFSGKVINEVLLRLNAFHVSIIENPAVDAKFKGWLGRTIANHMRSAAHLFEQRGHWAAQKSGYRGTAAQEDFREAGGLYWQAAARLEEPGLFESAARAYGLSGQPAPAVIDAYERAARLYADRKETVGAAQAYDEAYSYAMATGEIEKATTVAEEAAILLWKARDHDAALVRAGLAASGLGIDTRAIREGAAGPEDHLPAIRFHRLMVEIYRVRAERAPAEEAALHRAEAMLNYNQLVILYGKAEFRAERALLHLGLARIVEANGDDRDGAFIEYREAANLADLVHKEGKNPPFDIAEVFLDAARLNERVNAKANAVSMAASYYERIRRSDDAVKLYRMAAELYGDANDQVSQKRTLMKIVTLLDQEWARLRQVRDYVGVMRVAVRLAGAIEEYRKTGERPGSKFEESFVEETRLVAIERGVAERGSTGDGMQDWLLVEGIVRLARDAAAGSEVAYREFERAAMRHYGVHEGQLRSAILGNLGGEIAKAFEDAVLQRLGPDERILLTRRAQVALGESFGAGKASKPDRDRMVSHYRDLLRHGRGGVPGK